MSCKNIYKSSVVAGKRLALSFAMVNPAAENTLSEDEEVAGMHKILLANGLVDPPPCQRISETVINI